MRRNGCWSRSRGTAITSVFPSSSASRRACVWGESGLALITCARFQARERRGVSAASFAPAKFGIRPSAPGKRETPSRSIAFHTARRTWSFERIGADTRYTPARADRLRQSRLMAPDRTSLSHPAEATDEEPVEESAERSPAVRPRDLLARDRARSAARRLGSLRTRRGGARPDPDRVPVPLLVPGRGRGDRERARPRAAPCSSPITPARFLPTPR